MFKNTNFRKFNTIIAGLSLVFLTACGQTATNDNLTDVVSLKDVNAELISIQTNSDAGVSTVSDYLPDDSEGRELGAVTMTIKGAPTTQNGERIAEVGSLGSKLSYYDAKWTISNETVEVAQAGEVPSTAGLVNMAGIQKYADFNSVSYTYEYSSDNTDVANVSGDGVVTPAGEGTAKISVYRIGANKKHYVGWYTVTIIDGHVHVYKTVYVPAKCNEKGYTETVCKEFNEVTGEICNDIKDYVEYGAAGHRYYTAKTTYEGGYAIGHIVCSRCGASYTEKKVITNNYSNDDED